MNSSVSMKIVIACFLGGAIGSLAALQLGVLWWVGVIAGGLTGWISYEPMKIVSAARIVARQIDYKRTVDLIDGILDFVGEALVFLSAAMVCVAGALIGLFVVLVTICVSLVAFIGAQDLTSFAWEYCDFWCSFELPYIQDNIVGGTYVTTLCGLVALLASRVCSDKSYLYGGACFILLSPSIAPIAIVTVLIWCACMILSCVPHVARFMYSFIKKVFLIVHSEVRLLCLTDALVGACIGYFNGNPMVGGIAGAILGVLNFELVSKRLLKLVLK